MKKIVQIKRIAWSEIPGFHTMIIIFLLSLGTLALSQTVTVNSLAELKPYLSQDNVDIKLVPGTYSINAADVAAGKFSNPVLLFSGSNSTYDFTDVIINFDTDVLTAFGNVDVKELNITGNNNVLKNLTMVDDGTVDDRPTRTATNVVMDGENNRIEGFHVTIKGSYPYGYGDAYGKGSGYIIKHFKHSACLVRGNFNHLKNSTFIQRSYGHGIYLQGANDALIEGCYVEGEVRSTDDMLKDTSGAAYERNFQTIWGYRLPPGYMMSLNEDGIRTYRAGTTVINGITYTDRGTENITVRDCTVKNMRAGVTLYLGYGYKKFAENCTVIGCEVGYMVKGGAITNCRGDAAYGPLFQSADDSGVDVDITVIPPVDGYYNGSGCMAYINGNDHTILLNGAGVENDAGLKVQLGGDNNDVRALAADDDYQSATNMNIDNLTVFPLLLTSSTSGNNGTSGGMVTDLGTNNNINYTQVSVLKIEAEDYSTMNGVTTEINGDVTHVTSIESGDYMEYEIDVPYAGTYTMQFQVASESVDGNVTLRAGGTELETIKFSATGSGQTWNTVASSSFYLSEGVQTLRIDSKSNGWNLDWMSLNLGCAEVKIVPTIEVYNQLGELFLQKEENSIFVFPGNTAILSAQDILLGAWSWSGPDGFSSDSRSVTLSKLQKDQSGEYILSYTNECGQTSTQTFSVIVQDTFVIEAESYSRMNGVVVETTTDVNGGSDVMINAAGDWIEFDLTAPFSAVYTLDYRIAGANNNGDFSLSINGEDADQHTFMASGGAQVWETTGSQTAIYLTEGTQTLRITANNGGWNINWFQLKAQDFVSPCRLPFNNKGFKVINETVNWSSGVMDISCAVSVDVCITLSETGTLTEADSLNVYYKLDGGDLIEITKNTGSIRERVNFARSLSGTTLEIVVRGASASADNYYNIDKISVIETVNPFEKIEAEDYDDYKGVRSYGSYLGNIDQDEWSMYAGLDLTGIQSIKVSVGTPYDDVYIEVRLDSINGPIYATIDASYTGNNTSYLTSSSYVNGVAGIYDVYFVYRKTDNVAEFCNIDWFQMSEVYIKGPTNPYERFEAEINDGESGTMTANTTDVDGGKELGNLEDGDYILFSELDLGQADSIVARVASANYGGVIEVRLNSALSGDIIAFIDVPNTGSESTWETVSVKVNDVEGSQDVYFVFLGEGSDLFKLNWLQFTRDTSLVDRLEAEDYNNSSYSFFEGATQDPDDDGGAEIRYTKAGSWIQFSDVDLTAALSVKARYGTNYDDAKIEVRINAPDGQLIGEMQLNNTGSFNNWETVGTNINEVNGVHNVYFVYLSETSSVVCNSNWFQFSTSRISEKKDPLARIEAEDYDRASGTTIRTTSDVDGDKELASIKDKDWILFKDIDLTGITGIDVRVANQNATSTIYFRLNSYNGPLYSFISILNTGSSLTWQTLSTKSVFSKEGMYDVYAIFKGSTDDLVNINWLQFTTNTTDLSNKYFGQEVKIYPNPVKDYVTISNAQGGTAQLYTMSGAQILKVAVNSDEYTVPTENLGAGIYLLKITHDNFTKNIKLIKD